MYWPQFHPNWGKNETSGKEWYTEKNRGPNLFSHLNWSSGEFHPQFWICFPQPLLILFFANSTPYQNKILQIFWTNTQFHSHYQIEDETGSRGSDEGPKDRVTMDNSNVSTRSSWLSLETLADLLLLMFLYMPLMSAMGFAWISPNGVCIYLLSKTPTL